MARTTRSTAGTPLNDKSEISNEVSDEGKIIDQLTKELEKLKRENREIKDELITAAPQSERSSPLIKKFDDAQLVNKGLTESLEKKVTEQNELEERIKVLEKEKKDITIRYKRAKKELTTLKEGNGVQENSDDVKKKYEALQQTFAEKSKQLELLEGKIRDFETNSTNTNDRRRLEDVQDQLAEALKLCTHFEQVSREQKKALDNLPSQHDFEVLPRERFFQRQIMVLLIYIRELERILQFNLQPDSNTKELTTEIEYFQQFVREELISLSDENEKLIQKNNELEKERDELIEEQMNASFATTVFDGIETRIDTNIDGFLGSASSTKKGGGVQIGGGGFSDPSDFLATASPISTDSTKATGREFKVNRKRFQEKFGPQRPEDPFPLITGVIKTTTRGNSKGRLVEIASAAERLRSTDFSGPQSSPLRNDFTGPQSSPLRNDFTGPQSSQLRNAQSLTTPESLSISDKGKNAPRATTETDGTKQSQTLSRPISVSEPECNSEVPTHHMNSTLEEVNSVAQDDFLIQHSKSKEWWGEHPVTKGENRRPTKEIKEKPSSRKSKTTKRSAHSGPTTGEDDEGCINQ